jgi:hypothetical protein
MDNCDIVGITTGYYKVISNYNVGYIDITYNEIYDSPFIESLFNKNNRRSVHITKKDLLGPFILHTHKNRAGYSLEYNCMYDTSKYFMTMFDN